MNRPSELTKELRTLDMESASGRARALAIVGELRITGDARAIQALLPFVVAGVRPAPHDGWRVAGSPDPDLAAATHECVDAIVSRTKSWELVGVDELLRSTPIWFADAWVGRWRTVEPSQVNAIASGSRRLTVLGLLAGHPSGYVREAAVAGLAALGPESLPWLLIRTLDWVEPVRTRATRAVHALLVDEHAVFVLKALPLVHRLGAFTRVNTHTLRERVIAFLGRQPTSRLEIGLTDADRRVRVATLELLGVMKRIEPRHVEAALSDRDVAMRLAAARIVSADASHAPSKLGLVMCRDPFAPIRVLGLNVVVAAVSNSATGLLRTALDDVARSVRETARYHLSGHSSAGASLQPPVIDFAAHYRAAVCGGSPTVGAIRGLAEVGDPSDWELLVPMLDTSPARARAALESVRSLNRDETRELRLMMVDDPRPGVSRVAAESLRTGIWPSDEPSLRKYLTSPIEHVRRNAMPLITGLPGWRPALILFALHDPALAEPVNDQLSRWLARHWTTSGPPAPTESTELRALIDSSSLVGSGTKARFRELLEFVAPKRADG